MMCSDSEIREQRRPMKDAARALAAFAVLLAFWMYASNVLAQPARAFQDCDHCPQMVQLPAGRFTMGVSSDTEERHAFPPAMRGSGLPLREVTIARPFAMGQFPVTIAEFRAFVQDTGYDAGNLCTTQHRVDGHMIYEEARGYSWRDPGFPQTDEHPVVCVSWYDATAYAEWLSRKTGQVYSLPNEAEFEYAARAGTTTDFFWGNGRAQQDDIACRYANLPDLDQGRAMGDVPMGWTHRFQCSDGWAYTSPVRAYRPNPWGLHDMLGNIWEWVEDCWTPNYADAPTDGSTRRTGDCDAHGSMGGSYGNAAFSAFAGMRAPRDAEYRGHSWGFRVVRRQR